MVFVCARVVANLHFLILLLAGPARSESPTVLPCWYKNMWQLAASLRFRPVSLSCMLMSRMHAHRLEIDLLLRAKSEIKAKKERPRIAVVSVHFDSFREAEAGVRARSKIAGQNSEILLELLQVIARKATED